MAKNRDDQSSLPSDHAKVNAGVHGDLSSGYQEYPKGEPQHDDVSHRTGIGSDVFEPRLKKS